MAPRMIRTELDEGVTTWVPYGISVDVSEWVEALRNQCDELVRDFKAGQALPPAASTKK